MAGEFVIRFSMDVSINKGACLSPKNKGQTSQNDPNFGGKAKTDSFFCRHHQVLVLLVGSAFSEQC